MNLAHDVTKDEVKLKPFTPGHVAVYSLDSYGMATFVSEKRFHGVGALPRYQTSISEYGESKTTLDPIIKTILWSCLFSRLTGQGELLDH